MQTIFNTNLLPMVSNCDKTLIYRVFQHSHSTPNPLYNTPAADIHYTLTTSFQIFQSGVFALTCLNMRKMFRQWCKQCALCVRKGLWLDQRGFKSGPEDLMLVSVLWQECLGFQTVSCDIFCEIKVLAHSRARARPSYAVSILIVGDIATRLVALIPMKSCAMTDVSQALDVLDACKMHSGLWSSPPQSGKWTHQRLSMQKIEVIVVPAGHQFCDPVERSIQEVKKSQFFTLQPTEQFHGPAI